MTGRVLWLDLVEIRVRIVFDEVLSSVQMVLLGSTVTHRWPEWLIPLVTVHFGDVYETITSCASVTDDSFASAPCLFSSWMLANQILESSPSSSLLLDCATHQGWSAVNHSHSAPQPPLPAGCFQGIGFSLSCFEMSKELITSQCLFIQLVPIAITITTGTATTDGKDE